MHGRLIDADALLRDIEHYHVSDRKMQHWVEIQPTVDAVPVVHGRWISDEGDVLFHCSECETQISTSWDYDDLQWNYCPSCGAKMDGKDDSDGCYGKAGGDSGELV